MGFGEEEGWGGEGAEFEGQVGGGDVGVGGLGGWRGGLGGWERREAEAFAAGAVTLGFFVFAAEAGFLGEAAALLVAGGGAGGGVGVEFALLEELGFSGVLEGGLGVEVGLLAVGFEVGALEVLFGG